MANKIVNIDQLEEDLTSIANTIRAKDGSSELLQYPDDFISKLNGFYSAADFTTQSKPVGAVYYEGTTINSLLAQHSAITSIIMPNVTTPVTGMFRYSKASIIRLDKLQYVSSYSFDGCSNIVVFCFPRMSSINSQNSFSNCTKLTTLDLGGKRTVTSAQIGNQYNFTGSTKISKIILRNTNVVWNLTNTSVLNPTCFKSGGTGGTLYVPENLISQYEEHENWAVYLAYPNNKILSIEGSEYEDYYADGRLISSVA